MTTYEHPRHTVLNHMRRTSGRLSDAVMAAAFGCPEQEFKRIAEEVAIEARYLLDSIEGTPVPVDAFISENPYISPNVPKGYNTVLGYIEEGNPGFPDEMFKLNASSFQRDERKMRAVASRRKIPICRVTAPIALQEQGVETVIAYPVNLIREVLY